MPQEIKQQLINGELKPIDYDEKIAYANNKVGKLTGYQCDICKNKGFVYKKDPYNAIIEIVCECKCVVIRQNLKNIQKSGLSHIIDIYTFENFIAKAEWQKKAKEIAFNFSENWLYIGGQVGCGKSHLGTAVVSKFLKDGTNCRYMVWREEIVKIKACVNDFDNYQKLTENLKKVELLYIDDFFKTEKDKVPTQADINFAHELLNHRYMNRKKTIISSELFISDILEIDEAVGSRIYQLTKNNCIEVSYDKNKNQRLK